MGMADGGVREFYAGRCVFLTGATGYLGKVTLEKLLYACPEVSKVYILVRPKRGKSPEVRLKELTNSPAFGRLRAEYPDFDRKIVLMDGDVEKAALGLSDGDVQTLLRNTSVIIHNAATVRFTEPLKKAVRINVLGVRELLQLAKRMDKLEAFVHVSTAFSNCYRTDIGEKLYEQRLTPQELIHTVSWMTDDELVRLLPMFLQGYPNTYTFTKGAAELLIASEKGDFPTAIMRPSVILSSVADPVAGWMDGLSGANAASALQGKGILRTMLGNNKHLAQIIPVDTVANSSIVAGWQLAKDKPEDPLIVNVTSGVLCPILWGDVFGYGAIEQYRYPSKYVIRPPVYVMFTTSGCWRRVLMIFDQYIPAVLLDVCSLLTGQKPTYLLSLGGVSRFASVTQYFSSGHWNFEQSNIQKLSNDMTPQERMIFNCDVRTVNWKKFIADWWLGTKLYVFKEDPADQHLSDKRFRRIVLRRRIVYSSLTLGVLAAVVYSCRDTVLPLCDQVCQKTSVLFKHTDNIDTMLV